MRHRDQVKAACEAFEIFHAKEPRFVIRVPKRLRRWPEYWALVGPCKRVYYESDKWHEDGDTDRYYHDHGSGIRFWLAADGIAEGECSPVELPSALTCLGLFLGADVVCSDGKRDRKQFAEPSSRDVLCCDPNREFLVALDQRTGPYAIIEGPGLTILSEGIDG